MIIAIDGYEANVSERVGIGRFAFETITHLYRQLEHYPQHRIRIYLPGKPLPDWPAANKHWEYRVCFPAKIWTLFAFPRSLVVDRPRADVVFSPTHYIPRFVTLPRVMTIMDLSYLNFPEMFKAKDLYQLRRWTAYSVKNAAKIITISRFSRNAIIKAYQVDPGRVVVIYPGLTMINKLFPTKIKPIMQKYGLTSPFILAVGTLQPRKNYERLIEAFAQFRKNQDLELVIIGKKGWLYKQILEAPKRFGVAEKVKFLDFVPDAELSAFYQNALCLAMPSLYEGFGLPVLEAMAYGCQVVVSNISSLPEIAGKTGVYVDPQDVGSIAKGLLTAIKERNQSVGESRIKTGLARAKQFTWKRTANQTLKILEEVAKSNKNSF